MMDEAQGGSAEAVTERKPAVVCLVADLFFVPRLADVIDRQGGIPVIVETPSAMVEAVDRTYPVLVLVDLNVDGDWRGAVRRVKQRPHSRQTPLYAFGAHVAVDLLRQARAAGADHAWARSRMMDELPQLVARHIRPPVRYPDGWEDSLSAKAQKGVVEFNKGDYFEQHEYFEEAWLEETRPIREMYQGLLQVGVAFYLIEEDNWAGALKMFRRGLPRLRDLPAVCQGVDLAAFRTQAEAIHAELTALGPGGMAEIDRALFPRIDVRPDWKPGDAHTA